VCLQAVCIDHDGPGIGLDQPAQAEPIPEGKISPGQVVKCVNGAVRFMHVLMNAPVPTLAERREHAIADLKQRRWEVEISGLEVEINGEPVTVSTARGDDRLNLHIMLTLFGAGQRPDCAVFNFADGKPRAVSNADMLMAIAKVQMVSFRKAEVTPLIEVAHMHAVMEAADAEIWTGWPA
jgi:hypothetical protein